MVNSCTGKTSCVPAQAQDKGQQEYGAQAQACPEAEWGETAWEHKHQSDEWNEEQQEPECFGINKGESYHTDLLFPGAWYHFHDCTGKKGASCIRTE